MLLAACGHNNCRHLVLWNRSGVKENKRYGKTLTCPEGYSPYNGPNWEVPPERGIFFPFFRLQVHESVGISLVEVHKRVEKSVILVCKKAQKG